MENQRLLYDAFNIYYNKGIEAIRTNNYTVARRNILAAADTLLKLAQISQGELKTQRINRAEELVKLADKIEAKQYKEMGQSSNAGNDLAKFGAKNNSSVEDKGKSENKESKFVPVEKTGIRLSDVAGLKSAKEEINRLIIEPIKHPEIYDKFKKKKGGGILLYGAPGTGKTMFAQAIASEIDAKFYSIKCSDIASKWFGDSEQNVKELFEEARKHPCSIIFFDEFESLGAKRDSYSTVMKRLVPELLAQIQGFEKSDNLLLVIAATNRPWDIDSAFLRPGRFNTAIYVPLPDAEAREFIIRKELYGVPIDSSIDFSRMVKITEGFNGADVVEFCEKLKDYAIKRSIESGKESEIVNSDIDRTAERVKSSVRLEDLEKISKYEKSIGKV